VEYTPYPYFIDWDQFFQPTRRDTSSMVLMHFWAELEPQTIAKKVIFLGGQYLI
jgi:hypothetical protein